MCITFNRWKASILLHLQGWNSELVLLIADIIWFWTGDIEYLFHCDSIIGGEIPYFTEFILA